MFVLCLVTAVGDVPVARYNNFLMAAIKGGVDLVEWREKHVDEKKLTELRVIKNTCDQMQVPLLINDFPEIAKKINAAGVHLGNQDATPAVARQLLGEKAIIGVSIETWDDLTRANNNPAVNYMTASAVFPSQQKDDLKTHWGLNGLTKLQARAKKPLTAIGGITEKNLSAVMATGIQGVAVITALHEILWQGLKLDKNDASIADATERASANLLAIIKKFC